MGKGIEVCRCTNDGNISCFFDSNRSVETVVADASFQNVIAGVPLRMLIKRTATTKPRISKQNVHGLGVNNLFFSDTPCFIVNKSKCFRYKKMQSSKRKFIKPKGDLCLGIARR